MTDTIDIVILNCNNNGVIQDCIQSIHRNTPGAYNLIVVDQGSHDGSPEWLDTDGNVSHLILNKRNKGVAEGRNQGIRAGRNPWVAIIDSDIIIKDPEWLDKMWNYTSDRAIGSIEARVKIHDWENGTWHFSGMAFCLIRRECLQDIGIFDPVFFIGEDIDWQARLEWSGWRTAFCPDTDILHTCGQTMHGVLGHRYGELERQRDMAIHFKYTPAFLERTVQQLGRRRRAKEIEMLIK